MGKHGERLRRILGRAAGGAAAFVVVAAGIWSLMAASGAPAAKAGELALPGGLVRVERVSAAAPAHGGMPGMGSNNDPVPDGQRRITVDITLVATGRSAVSYRADDFSLQAGSSAPVRPHSAVLPGTTLPPGARLSGAVVFDVPDSATSGALRVAGGRPVDVALPVTSPGAHSGSAASPTRASATAGPTAQSPASPHSPGSAAGQHGH